MEGGGLWRVNRWINLVQNENRLNPLLIGKVATQFGVLKGSIGINCTHCIETYGRVIQLRVLVLQNFFEQLDSLSRLVTSPCSDFHSSLFKICIPESLRVSTSVVITHANGTNCCFYGWKGDLYIISNITITKHHLKAWRQRLAIFPHCASSSPANQAVYSWITISTQHHLHLMNMHLLLLGMQPNEPVGGQLWKCKERRKNCQKTFIQIFWKR